MAVALTIRQPFIFRTDPRRLSSDGTDQGRGSSFEFSNGVSTIVRYLFKSPGIHAPVGHQPVPNFNMNRARPAHLHRRAGFGSGRNHGTLTYNTLQVLPNDAVRFEPGNLLDVGVHKVFKMRGGRNA